jgi:hypothetical protein
MRRTNSLAKAESIRNRTETAPFRQNRLQLVSINVKVESVFISASFQRIDHNIEIP